MAFTRGFRGYECRRRFLPSQRPSTAIQISSDGSCHFGDFDHRTLRISIDLRPTCASIEHWCYACFGGLRDLVRSEKPRMFKQSSSVALHGWKLALGFSVRPQLPARGLFSRVADFYRLGVSRIFRCLRPGLSCHSSRVVLASCSKVGCIMIVFSMPTWCRAFL